MQYNCSDTSANSLVVGKQNRGVTAQRKTIGDGLQGALQNVAMALATDQQVI